MKISYLLLGYNRPKEARNCIDSIKRFSHFDYQIIYLCNGGNQNHATELYEEGKIDKLILNKENSGCGFGTTDLFRACNTKYAFYVQVDQILKGDVTQDIIDHLLKKVEDNGYKFIDLSGIGGGTYTERAHFVDVDWYNSIPNKPNGGPGPYEEVMWNEEYLTNYLKSIGNPVLSLSPWFADMGKTSVRENPDGSEWEIRTDTKELRMITPPKEKFRFPNFTDEEWERVIKGGRWKDWEIPEKEKKNSFKCWKH